MYRFMTLCLLTLLAAGPLSAQDDERERMREKQREIAKLLEQVDRTVNDLSIRLEKKDPEGTKRLRDAWVALKQKAVEEDMKEVDKLISQGLLKKAIAKADEVIAKLEEVLKLLLGTLAKEEDNKPRLADLKKSLDDLLKKEKDNKSKLDELRKETAGALEDLSNRLDKAIEQQQALQKETALIPPPSLIDLLKEILAKIVHAHEAIAKVRTPEEHDAVAKEAAAIDEPMKKAFEMLHGYGQELAHKFKSARDQISDAAKDLAEGSKKFETSAGYRNGSLTHLKTAEQLIREIIQLLEEREKTKESVAQKQGDLSKDIDKIGQDAAKLGKESDDSKIKDSLDKAAKSLQDAQKSSDQAKADAAKGDPSAAKDEQKKTDKGLHDAKAAVDDAKRAKQAQMNDEQKKKLNDIQKEQAGLSKQAEDLAKKMGDNPSAKGVENAQNSMDKAAEKMNGPDKQSPQGQQGQQDPKPDQAKGQDLGKATEHQKDAIDELEKAKNDIDKKNQEEALGALEKKLTEMIAEQKKINATTSDLDAKKKQMGELSRDEKFGVLKQAAEKQQKLSDTALECKGICESAEAFEMAWAFDVVSQEMRQVSKLLDDNQTGALPQRKEEFILKTLEALLQAVKEKKAQGPSDAGKKDDNKNDPKKNEGDQGKKDDGQQADKQPSNEMLGVEAEIRLIIEMQKHLRDQTEEIGRANAKRDQIEPLHKEIMEDLKKRQTDLLDRLEQVISRVGVSETQGQVERKGGKGKD